MKILTSKQMAAADRATFDRLGVPQRAVMESAGRAVAMFVADNFHERLTGGVLVVCGSGNNGGDGYVAARALFNLGIEVWALALTPTADLRGDAKLCAESFIQAGGVLIERQSKTWEETCLEIWARSPTVIIDAVFGTGLSREITGELSESIGFVNALASSLGAPLIAIDVPSGVSSDTGEILGTSIAADVTLALQNLKPGHVMYPGSSCCGEVFLVDIGVTNETSELADIGLSLIDEGLAQELITECSMTSPQAHKGTRGHVLVVGGSEGKYGAAQLAAHAALACGAGMVTVLLGENSGPMFASDRPEIMFSRPPEKRSSLDEFLRGILNGKDTIVAGPGIGQSAGASELLEKLFDIVREAELPIVIDADALNLIATHAKLRGKIPPQAILTPHPGEMARLLGQSIPDVQTNRLSMAERLAGELAVTVVLKGARTIVSVGPNSTYVNPAASSVLGTAGSGDVLSGVIGALLAQGLNPQAAALLGVFVHGGAGELLEREEQGLFGPLASDIIRSVPRVMNILLTAEMPAPPRFYRKILPGSFHVLGLDTSE